MDDKECNCSFALAIANKTYFRITQSQDDRQSSSSTSFLINHSNAIVEKLHKHENADQAEPFPQASEALKKQVWWGMEQSPVHGAL
jgi:hypothetical protein